VFHLKGYVDVEFPLEDFELKGDTLIYKKSWNINGLGIKGKVLPYQLTIVVPSKNIHKVYEIKPKKISPEEAEKIGKAAGIILAPIGGYFFAKMGGLAGGTVCAFISKFKKFQPICGFSGQIGKLIGGALGGIGTYLITSKVVSKMAEGFSISEELTVAEKEEILQKAKALIVAEIAFDPQLQKELTQSFENYVKNFFAQFGIKIKKIKYKNPQEI